MSRRSAFALLLLSICLLLTAVSGVTLTAVQSKDKSSSTLKVDCARGESINKALSQPVAGSLVVEISGLCHENVVVTRDRVTLRGADPATDGVDALDNAEITDAAVWVRDAHHVVLENLKLTGGFIGLLATNVNVPSMILTNCRMEGNSNFGMQLQQSLVEATDTVFDSNGSINTTSFGGSRFLCRQCTFSNPQSGLRINALVSNGSRLLFNDCTLTGGGIQSDDALVLVSDSSIQYFAPNGPAVNASGASTIVLTRVQVEGPLRFSQSSTVQLFGVTQMPVPGFPGPLNSVDNSAFARIGDASLATGGPPVIASSVQGFALRNFSNLSLLQTSHVTGNLVCSTGGNAFCQTPANVSGTSNCGLCPKP
jgi:hypothetical protein